MVTISIDEVDKFDFERALRTWNETRRTRGDIDIYPQKRGPEPSGRSTYFGVPEAFLDELQRAGVRFEVEVF